MVGVGTGAGAVPLLWLPLVALAVPSFDWLLLELMKWFCSLFWMLRSDEVRLFVLGGCLGVCLLSARLLLEDGWRWLNKFGWTFIDPELLCDVKILLADVVLLKLELDMIKELVLCGIAPATDEHAGIIRKEGDFVRTCLVLSECS